MAFVNLPGIFEDKLDGNLSILPANSNPVVVVLGTAQSGSGDTLYTVNSASIAAAAFGTEGTLIRGMYEASVAGAQNINLFRIGATQAKLSNIASGVTITVDEEGDTGGTDYQLYYDSSVKRLQVFRSSDSTLVYDNNPAYPPAAVDLEEVSVDGVYGVGASIGSSSVPITLAAANGVGGAVYAAGTDGLTLSRMQTYEALFNAYLLLSDQQLDVVLPMSVFLNDLNVMDLNPTQIAALGLNTMTAYPLVGTPTDALGKLFTQEYLGTNYFWWWFPSNTTTNTDAQFTADGGADIHPSAGAASATTDCFGNTLDGADFHEVNFAYQLAQFCYQQSSNQQEMNGVIGVLPPNSFSLQDISQWVGTLPTTVVDGNGNTVITVNGTGLLGNKFMSGRVTSGGVGGHIVNGIDGLFNGGFIATDSGWLDDQQQFDANKHLIDIGKHLSISGTYPILANPSLPTSYVASGASTYGGFFSGLSIASAPTNKLLTTVRLPYRLGTPKLDLLAGQRYVTFHQKPKGIVVSDAPTAARPDSDYTRLSTMRIVKASIDAIRAVAEPFLGNSLSGSQQAALESAIDNQLSQLVKQGVLVRYQESLTVTAQQRVLGQATLQLVLVPAFELRQLTVTVALAAV